MTQYIRSNHQDILRYPPYAALLTRWSLSAWARIACCARLQRGRVLLVGLTVVAGRRGRLLRLAVLMLAWASLLIGAEPNIDGLTTIRIMPLGDSITAGYGADVGGYREQLKNRLASAGYNAVFVGSQSTFNLTSDPSLAHEGHSGWTIPQITSIVTGSFSLNSTSANQVITTANPDVVMLMIGTNDMLGSNGMGIDPNLYRQLLDAIYVQKPTVRVIVMPFIYCSIFADVQGDNVNYGGRDIRFINSQNVVVARLDGGLVQIITGYQRAGRRISFYDGLNLVVTPANCHDTAVLTDGVHPTAGTYEAMGNALVRAIQDVSSGVLDGSVLATMPSGLIATANGAGFDLAWTRNSANETGFQIDATSDPAFQNGITTVTAPAGSNGASITGLLANTHYYLRIRAVDAAGASANTTPSEATTGTGGSSVLSTPAFSPDGGTYTSTQAVTLSCATVGAAIHFTIDGSTPTAASTTYSGAISVPSTTTIKAVATASGLSASAVASATYTIAAPATVPTPVISPGGGTYTSTQAVTLSCSTGGAAIHFTIDGTTPTGSSPTYTSAINVASTTTIKAIATASGMSASAVASATYTITAGSGLASVTGLQASGEASTQINATWTNPGGATAVEVQYDTDPGYPAPTSLILGATTDHVQIAHLTPSMTYFLRVRCTNGASSSAWVGASVATLALVDLVMVGDSITYGWGYASSGRNTVGKGIPGDQSGNASQRFFADVITLRPRLVTIMIGTNDIANGVTVPTIESNLTAMVQTARSNGIGVILGTVPPAGNTTVRPTGLIDALNDWIATYAASQGLRVADYHAAMWPYNAGDFGDGLHPSTQGYAKMSAVLDAVLPLALADQGSGYGSAPADPTAYPNGDGALSGVPFGDGSAPPEYAWDGNPNTMYESGSDSGSNGYTGLDLGAPKRITGYRFLANQDPVNRLYRRSFGARLQGSNSSATTGFIDIALVSLVPFSNRTVAYGITDTNSYRWVRMFSATGGLCDATEIALVGTTGGSSTVAMPTFSPAGGTYTSPQAVTLSCSTSGAIIHFTTDGSTPTASSTTYNGTINVASTMTITAIATASNMTASAAGSATYTISTPGTVATPTFSPAGGTYTSPQAVTLSCSTGGAIIHFTTDGSTPTASSSTSSGAMTVANTTTIKMIATASGLSDSAVASATYTIAPGITAAQADSGASHRCGIGSGLAAFILGLLTMVGRRQRSAPRHQSACSPAALRQ